MKLPFKWRNLLYLAVACVVIAGIMDAYHWRKKAACIRMLADSPFGMLEEAGEIANEQKKGTSDYLLLHGADDAESEAARWKPLWDSDPQNPVYFAEYTRAVFRDTKAVPEEILVSAEKIDPGNGWYLALKASALLKDAIERQKQSNAERETTKVAPLIVKKEEHLRGALDLLHQAAAMPRYVSHFGPITSERIKALGRAEDWIDMIPRITYLAGIPYTGVIETREASRALAVAAVRSGERGDADEFHRVATTWQRLIRSLLEDSSTVIEALIAKVFIGECAPYFRDAALKLGLEKEAAQFESLTRWHQEDRERKKSRSRAPSEQELLIEQRSSLLAGLTLPVLESQVRNPPVITEADLRPARLAEHAFFLRILLRLGCVLLLMCGIAVGIRSIACASVDVRRQSALLCDALPVSDWLRIFLIGGLLPALLYGVMLYFTPLTTREWSFQLFGMFLMPLQFSTCLVMMFALIGAMASRTCDLRMADDCGVSRFPRLRWVMVGFAFAGFLLAGTTALWMRLPAPGGRMLLITLWIAGFLSAVPLLWMVFRVIKPRYGRLDLSPRSATLARISLPGIMIVFLLFSSAMPALHQEERFWMAADQLLALTPEAPALNRYEWKITRILAQELKEVLDDAFPVTK